MTDSVGIIGAGRLGQAMARTALRAGRRVVIANSRGPESLTSVISTLGEGVSAGTVDEAAAAGIVVIAVPWDHQRHAKL
jgi:predicted dinucleotide-binding enzyme